MTILKTPQKKTPSSLGIFPKNQTARHRVFGISQASQAAVPWHFSRALTRATAARDGGVSSDAHHPGINPNPGLLCTECARLHALR